MTTTLRFLVQFQNVNNTEKTRLFSKNKAVKQIYQTEQWIIANQDAIKNINDKTTYCQMLMTTELQVIKT